MEVSTVTKPVYVKEEPVETNTDVKPVFQQHEVDMKPASIKREIITPVSPTTELENPETTMSSVSVFSRLGPKLQCHYTSSSTDKRRKRRFRRHNKKY
jgi:BRCT domain type II-containing protein